MPSPSSSLATLRPDLAASFQEFDLAMDRQGFIAGRVLPVLEVASQTGTFGKISIESLLQARDTKRAPGSGYNRQNYQFTSATYACEEHGAEEPVDDRERVMYANYLAPEQLAAERARDVVLRNYEQRVSAAVFNATTWAGSALTTAITNEWDDLANATPIDDVEAAIQKVYDNSGLRANALIIGWKVFRNLRNSSKAGQIVDRIKYAGLYDPTSKAISEAVLAQVFDVEHVIVAGAVKNAANEGAAASLSPVWSGEYAMVCKVATSQDVREPCIGRTFHHGADGSNIGAVVESYRDETVRSTIVRGRMDTDELILYPEAGHLLSNITT